MLEKELTKIAHSKWPHKEWRLLGAVYQIKKEQFRAPIFRGWISSKRHPKRNAILGFDFTILVIAVTATDEDVVVLRIAHIKNFSASKKLKRLKF